MIYKLPYLGKWRVFNDKDMAAWDAHTREQIQQYLWNYEQNPLAHYLPHGIPWSDKERTYAGGRIVIPPSEYKKEYGNDGVAFVSDYRNNYVGLLSPRKVGKSFAGANFVGQRSLKWNPSWLCYTDHNIMKPPEWDGPKRVVIASFSWPNVAELWKVYQEVLPKDELGPYCAGGKKGNPGFGDGRPKYMTMQKSGTEFIFLCYTQRLQVWSNFKAHYLHADEQIPLVLLAAWEEGTRTLGNVFTQACFTMSGFVLPERPDTGAAGELKRGIWDGRRTRGKSVGRYYIDVPSTPDAIISPAKKKEAYDMYANPDIDRTMEDERRGLAVYFPGWEPGSGLMFGADVWQHDTHIINPLWDLKKPAPANWTKWRVIDYADKQTTCCLWFGIGPVQTWWGEREYVAVLYRMLYEKNLSVADAVQSIIEMSHNVRRKSDDPIRDDRRGLLMDVYSEEDIGEAYYDDLLDPRAAAWPRDGELLLEIFHRYGMNNLGPACADHNVTQIPNLKDWLQIDYSKPHPFKRGANGEKIMGAPRLYFFDGVAQALIDEIESIPDDETGQCKIPRNMPHDGIDAAKYWTSSGPQYWGDDYVKRRQPEEEDRVYTPYTGT